MQVYTYCSCRSSHYGYQYSSFSSDSKGIVKSMLSGEMSEHNVISREFIEWCENKSGWQLVLVKNQYKDKYLIMAGQLEKSRELEKNKRKSRGETNFNENSLDSDFYMTLGFCGTAEEIKQIAVFLLNQYKDGFCDLFNTLEKTIKKAEDATRYEIDTSIFNPIFRGLSVPLHSSANSKNSILRNVVHRKKPYPDIRLSVDSAKTKRETLRVRKSHVEKCVELLSNIERFSEHILLLIAYNYFNAGDRANIHIDYEYLWYFGDKVY